jgi:peptidyl-prolyl cis-trans isomerase A (cyclophilin A)
MKAWFLAAALASLAGAVSAQTPLPPAPVAAPAPQPKTYATVRVVLTTSLGPITVALEKERAPITSANFLRYVDQKRFDGISFFRRSQAPGEPTKGFVQAGTTDPKRVLPPIAHEPTTKTGLSHIDGALSAPRFAPGTARGDFTIILGGAPWMDADPKAPGDNLGFAVFGRVVEGMDVVAKILAAPTSTTKGDGVFKGEILEPPVKILTARRAKVATP